MATEFPTVTFDQNRFRLVRGVNVIHEIEWSLIAEICVFKRDCFSYDVICLGIRIDESDNFVEVAEDFPGYRLFVAEIERRYLLEADWWRKVAFPAFETKLASIWKSTSPTES